MLNLLHRWMQDQLVREFIFTRFHSNAPNAKLENELFEQLQPGLTMYPNDPEAAAASLDKLLNFAMEKIPKTMYS